MAEITKSDDVIKKIKEFDTYLSQSSEVLKSLHRIKKDVEKQNQFLSQKREELTQFENDISALLNKAKTVSQEIDKILSPIRKEKEELERIDNNLTDGLARLDDTIRTKMNKVYWFKLRLKKHFKHR
jgi:DNA repair ATPase RecN